jgi:hypothetical protein
MLPSGRIPRWDNSFKEVIIAFLTKEWLTMNSLSAFVLENTRLVRRVTRLLSILLLGFFLSLILFNDDVREDLTLPFILYGLIVLSLLIAWRWERKGGLLTLVGSLLFGLFLLVNGILRYDFNLPLAIFGSAILTLPCFSAGWLFYTLGQQPEITESSGRQ